MKILSILLLAVTISLAYAQLKVRCRSNNGSCTSALAVPDSCQRLSYLCPRNGVCCKKNVSSLTKKNRANKRKCRARKKCSTKNGACVSKRKNDCSGETVDRLCKGGSCTCCLERSTCQCGKINEARIVGGKEVARNKYPWMVGIFARKVTTSGYICGAALIKDRYVVTAAHCVVGDKTGKPFKPKLLQVGLADHDQTSTQDDVAGVTRYVDVEKVMVADNYDIDDHDNDIALLKLKVPLDLTANAEIKPVCLPADDSKSYAGETGIVMGWGIKDNDLGISSRELLEVSVPILSKACKGDLPDYVDITDNMICAGTKKGGKDACIGDSGGPLVVKEGTRHVLVGIVSFGIGCAEPNVPGVYTRVTSFVDWIQENTRDGDTCA